MSAYTKLKTVLTDEAEDLCKAATLLTLYGGGNQEYLRGQAAMNKNLVLEYMQQFDKQFLERNELEGILRIWLES